MEKVRNGTEYGAQGTRQRARSAGLRGGRDMRYEI